MPANNNTDYINTTDYTKLVDKVKLVKQTLDDLIVKQVDSRKLRYADVNVEEERKANRLAPDELYVSQHIIDTNIRREQGAYVQFITQSPRAVICSDVYDPTLDLSPLEKDLSSKIRYPNWQLQEFANIDGFQANGYGVMEVVYSKEIEGNLATEFVQLADFGFSMDTRDFQACEMVGRAYYFTRTKLLSLKGNPDEPDEKNDWNAEEVDKLVGMEPTATVGITEDSYDVKDKSLFKVFKMMFRVQGIVHVAWACPDICKDWLRNPKPLYLGRRKLKQGIVSTVLGSITRKDKSEQKSELEQQAVQTIMSGKVPDSDEEYETQYPYFQAAYLISENDTISSLKGRVFLDQDVQEAVSSLVSSTLTKARRSAGLYFSREVSDPNDDLMQKNVYFKQGVLINSKIKEMQLAPPDPAIFNAIQLLVSANQNETSQVNFAVQNRKDSRKTAEEIKTASQQAAILSTVQVVLYSISLRKRYSYMASIIQTRVLAGLVKVNQGVLPLYMRRFSIKPAGDTDVIEKQQLINLMMQMWPTVSQTPIASQFLIDLLELMFPDRAAKYVQILQQAIQQQNSQQAQQMQQMLGFAKQVGAGVMKLSEHPEFFSDTGRIHALPIVQHVADTISQLQQQTKQKASQ